MDTGEADLLSEFTDQAPPEEASKGQRLVNYLVDLFVYYIFLVLLMVAYVLITGNIKAVEDLAKSEQYTPQLIVIFFYGLYMSLVEGLSKGRSLGKLITRTRVVRADNTRVSLEVAFKRGLIRIIPFEQFSALFFYRPWHDDWSNTRVIKI